MIPVLILFGYMVLLLSSCVRENATDSAMEEAVREVAPEVPRRAGAQSGCKTVEGRLTTSVAGIDLDFRFPATKYQGDLLILHAWNDAPSSWCSRSRICTKALNKGYRIIMPAMGKSVYCMQAYAETREDWQKFPTLNFLKDTLIPALREEYCVLKEGGYNFVIGLSAGARGAVRLVEEMPDLFVSAAALSGDYDPSLMKSDNIYRGFLGEYEAHPERWEKAENLAQHVAKVRTPLYLGHGEQDDFAPHTQSVELYNALRRANPNLNVRLNVAPDRGGSFGYWNYEISNIFRFFEQAQADLPEGSGY